MHQWIWALLLAFVAFDSAYSSRLQAFDIFDTCYDFSEMRSCGGGPFGSQVVSLQIKGGLAPAHYTERGRVWITNPLFFPTVFSFYRTAKFDKQFEVPWEVAAEFAYTYCPNAQLFVEGVFQQAEGKTRLFRAANFRIQEKFDDYRAISGYVGVRYFFDEWLCSISPFVGFKAGFVHNRKSKFKYYLNNIFIVEDTYLRATTGPSVGVQVGFDHQMCANWNAVLTFEAVASQSIRTNHNVTIPPFVIRRGFTGGATNLNIGDTGFLVSFPITLGFRYDF